MIQRSWALQPQWDTRQVRGGTWDTQNHFFVLTPCSTSETDLWCVFCVPRFVTVYNGPCHTYKVQRLSESTTYHFRIQAYNDAGEGAFSEVCAFTTTKSPPAPLKGELALPWHLLRATGGQDWILQPEPQPVCAGTEIQTHSEGLCLGVKRALVV